MIRTTILPQDLRLGALIVEVDTYDAWRSAARALLTKRVPPDEVQWLDQSGERQLLLGMVEGSEVHDDQSALPPRLPAGYSRSTRNKPATDNEAVIRVPKRFTELARIVACHRNRQRWHWLYRVLWRLTHGERELLDVLTDDDVHTLTRWAHEIRTDIEKMKAEIQFHRVQGDTLGCYVAWYQPAHRVLEWIVPFLRRRFGVRQWSVFTPDAAVHWDGELLNWRQGVVELPSLTGAAVNQQIDQWWNEVGKPLVVGQGELSAASGETRAADRASLPLEPNGGPSNALPLAGCRSGIHAAVKRKWRTIPSRSAEGYLPVEVGDLTALRVAALKCEGCELHKNATQTVFGRGPANARLVIVGEQPGDVEDRRGEPCLGAAGKLLDEVLEEVGIDRSDVYITNAVKHFKWTARGKRRMHARPTAGEVAACRPWIEAELQAIGPQVLVCLGATAVTALLGPGHRVTLEHGQVFSSEWTHKTVVVRHPSAILRAIDADHRAELREQFVADMKTVARLLRPRGRKWLAVEGPGDPG